MSDKRGRDPFSNRYAESETTETSETEENSKTSETSKTAEPSKTEKSSESVRERTNVNMYLAEDVVKDLRLAYAELNVDWQREYGEDMPKNDIFYPAIIKAAIENKDLKDVLDI